MVWACIWLDERGRPRRSKLVIMERDPDAQHGGYSAKSYIKALRKGLLPHYRQSQLFMQDNASVREFLAYVCTPQPIDRCKLSEDDLIYSRGLGITMSALTQLIDSLDLQLSCT
jgi:hypothetical protein